MDGGCVETEQRGQPQRHLKTPTPNGLWVGANTIKTHSYRPRSGFTQRMLNEPGR